MRHFRTMRSSTAWPGTRDGTHACFFRWRRHWPPLPLQRWTNQALNYKKASVVGRAARPYSHFVGVGNDLADQAVFQSLVRAHPEIALGIGHDLFVRLSGFGRDLL